MLTGILEGLCLGLITDALKGGVREVQKTLKLSGTVYAEFEKCYKESVGLWSINDGARRKMDRLKVDFLESFVSGLTTDSFDSIEPELNDLLEIFKVKLPEYLILSNYFQVNVLIQIQSKIGKSDELKLTEEGKSNWSKYNEQTISNLVNKVPLVKYSRAFETNGENVDNLLDFDLINKGELLEGRYLLYGNGGLGKSTYLKQLVLELLTSSPCFCIYLDAKNYLSNSSNNINITSSELSNAFFHLGRCFGESIKGHELDTFLKVKEFKYFETYLVVDGINEIPTKEERNSIIRFLDEVNSRFGVTVICSSRYKDGGIYNGWNEFKSKQLSFEKLKSIIEENSEKKIEELDKKTIGYLRIPFFLDKALKSHDFQIDSYSSFIDKHLFNSISSELRDVLLPWLSSIAFSAYQDKNISHIPIGAFIGVPKQIDLIEKNIILPATESEEFVKFEHQLVVDLLAANYIAEKQRRWTEDNFDIITYDSKSSWEIMQMILEVVKTKDHGSLFLMKLYNWSYYAVLWCLRFVDTEKFHRNDAIALVLIVSEKRYDIFSHTRKTVSKYLDGLFDKFDIDHADDYQELIRKNHNLVKTSRYSSFFEDVLNSEAISFEMAEKIIESDDPVESWAYSNLLKVNGLTIEVESQLKAYFRSVDKIERWRIVHSLGAAREDHTVHFLLDKITTDSYSWVSYGALRSVVEIFFRTKKEQIISELKKVNVLSKIVKNAKLSLELRNCLTSAPTNLKEVVESFVKYIIDDSNSLFTELAEDLQEWKDYYRRNIIE